MPPNRQARKPAPSPPTNEFHLILGLGRVYGGYLLLGEISLKEPGKNLPDQAFSISKISICVNTISVYLRLSAVKKITWYGFIEAICG